MPASLDDLEHDRRLYHSILMKLLARLEWHQGHGQLVNNGYYHMALSTADYDNMITDPMHTARVRYD